MANYDEWKQKYSTLSDDQKKKWNDHVNTLDAGSEAKQFTDRYNQEMSNSAAQTNNSSNFSNGTGTNGQNTTQNQTQGNQYQYGEQWNNLTERLSPQLEKTRADMQKLEDMGYGNKNNQVSPDLDQTKFQQDPGKITVQEGTAQQTGRPDYQANSEARLNEMKGNLDHYFATSPRMFSDRDTFNRVFEYNNRDSEAQRQLLDSYWKRKEDMDKASQYTSGESIMNGLSNSEITTDQLNLIKDTDPEAYRKRQELQEEEIKKRIVNDIVPPLLEAISQNMVNMMNNLGIQPQEAEDIEGVYNDTMDRTQAWQTMEDANRTVKRIEEVNNKRTAIMNRYASSTGGTVSDALAAARMQKALAPYDTEMQGLQYQYQDYANLFSQKQAAAYQAAQVRQMQASENQRVWNQRLTALGFAQTAMSYRTPEQQAQLRLQEQQAQNDMQLLQQSRLNDLNRYNQYATAKMQNQLQQELTDLSVEDEQQLKANLNNALSDYYKNYGDIIQRSQAQAVEDILAYAKEKGISVAQALTENFIKPLQNKPEYKQKVASDYGMLAKQSIGTINGKSVIMTTNPNGSISYQYIEDPDTTTAAKSYTQVDERAFNNNPMSTGYDGNTLYDFLDGKKTNGTQRGGQCGKFVNDYLESIGVERYFGNEDIKTRESRCNSETAKVGTIAVFDYNNTSSDGINHGHVAIVTKVYDDGSFDVVDSNFDKKNPEKIGTRRIYPGNNSIRGFRDPSKPASIISGGKETEFERNGNTYDFTKYPGWNDLTDDEWLTVESLLTYQTDPASLPKSGKENGASNSRVRAAASAIGREHGYNERKFKEVKAIEDQRYKAAGPGGSSSSNSTAMSILKSVSDSFSELENYDIQTVNSWINLFKTETGDPTVGALYTDLNVASAEIAKALKGGASATQDEKKEIEELLSGKMSTEQAKAVFQHFAKNLYEKNESEALNFYRVTGYKPEPIYTDDAAKRLTNEMGVDLSRYYNYNSGVSTGPKDEATRYYDGLQLRNKTYSNSELDNMVDEIFNS